MTDRAAAPRSPEDTAQQYADLTALVVRWRGRFHNPVFAVEAWGAFAMCADELEAALAAAPASDDFYKRHYEVICESRTSEVPR